MREMVLNHASFKLSSELEISEWLIDVTNGMKLLFENEILTLVLRTAKPLDEITCTPNQSLYEIIHSTQNKSKRYRDARLFFFKINAKFPLLREINEKLRSKFFGAESITQGLTAEDGKPLVFCIFNGSILVSFPLSQWDTDLLDVEYQHFMNDASIEELTNQIDNLARQCHSHR